MRLRGSLRLQGHEGGDNYEYTERDVYEGYRAPVKFVDEVSAQKGSQRHGAGDRYRPEAKCSAALLDWEFPQYDGHPDRHKETSLLHKRPSAVRRCNAAIFHFSAHIEPSASPPRGRKCPETKLASLTGRRSTQLPGRFDQSISLLIPILSFSFRLRPLIKTAPPTSPSSDTDSKHG